MTAPRPALAVVTAARAISSGQAGPGSAVQAARAGRPAASALRNAGPAGYLAQGPGSGRGSRAGAACAGRPSRLRPFRGGVALRYGEPEHVREGARVAVGDGAGQAGDFLGEHLLGGYHPLQVAEAALVLAVGGPLDEEAVGQLAREPDPDPDARPRLVGEPLGDEVVKRAVEVRERQVHRDPARRDCRPRAAGSACPWTSWTDWVACRLFRLLREFRRLAVARRTAGALPFPRPTYPPSLRPTRRGRPTPATARQSADAASSATAQGARSCAACYRNHKALTPATARGASGFCESPRGGTAGRSPPMRGGCRGVVPPQAIQKHVRPGTGSRNYPCPAARGLASPCPVVDRAG